MAKITRKLAKIFGLTAGTDEIAQFGSFADGSPAYSTDPDTIQSLSEYDDGWFSAVVAFSNPAIEDMNALFYLYAYQIAYIMQAGIPEYSATTTYYIGSLVNDGTGIVYTSLTDTNLGNALTDFTKWFTPTQNGDLTVNAMPGTAMTLPASKVMSWPNLTIGNGQTMTVPTGANLLCANEIALSGTGVVVATGTGVVRSF